MSVSIGTVILGVSTAATVAYVSYTAQQALAIYAEKELPRKYDVATTRQILKKESLAEYFKKEEEYAQFKQEIGKLAKRDGDVPTDEVATALDNLRGSPFYDAAKYKPIYRLLRKSQALGVASLSAEEEEECKKLPAIKGKANVCDLKKLLLNLYVELHNEDGPSGKPKSSG